MLNEQGSTTGGPRGRSSPLPAHQASPLSSIHQAPRFVGQLLYPAPPRSQSVSEGADITPVGALEKSPGNNSHSESKLDSALQVSANPRFGLVAVGTEG